MVIFTENKQTLKESFSVGVFADIVAKTLQKSGQLVRIELWTSKLAKVKPKVIGKTFVSGVGLHRDFVKMLISEFNICIYIHGDNLEIYDTTDEVDKGYQLIDEDKIRSFSVDRAAIVFAGEKGSRLQIYTK